MANASDWKMKFGKRQLKVGLVVATCWSVVSLAWVGDVGGLRRWCVRLVVVAILGSGGGGGGLQDLWWRQ
ncbi:hypothetical protein Tco_0513442 [Tanacetum coccineum]